jgi:hypothetical protein
MAKRRPHRTGSIFQRDGIWWIQFHVNGARQRESSYSAEKTEAERLLKRRLADAAVGKIKEFVPSSTTVSQLIQLVVEDYQLTRKRSLGGSPGASGEEHHPQNRFAAGREFPRPRGESLHR